MRTARLLTISWSIRWGEGVSQHALDRGVYPSMHWAGGVYPSMHWAGGCLPRGLSIQGGGRHTPGPKSDTPRGQTDTCENITLHNTEVFTLHRVSDSDLNPL